MVLPFVRSPNSAGGGRRNYKDSEYKGNRESWNVCAGDGQMVRLKNSDPFRIRFFRRGRMSHGPRPANDRIPTRFPFFLGQ